jgi:hypothetical protein
MKLRVTIDTDECSFDSISESMGGVIDIDNEGVAHWWYKCPSYFITFKDVEIISCEHDSREKGTNKCGDCGKDMSDSENVEQISRNLVSLDGSQVSEK